MLPSTIDPSLLIPTFDERWTNFTADEKGKSPAQWRTVLGAGGPTKPEYRCGSRDSIYVDPTFSGVKDGKVLSTPLGLEGVKINPGSYSALMAKPTPADKRDLCHGRRWTGAVLTTKFTHSQRFGYFEIRANLPIVKGMWPAFWLMPVRGTWPGNGEFDIMEALGVDGVTYHTVHTSDPSFGPSKQLGKEVRHTFPTGGPGAWHTFGGAWTKDELVWYVDRQEVFRCRTPSDMRDVPMYLMLDIAVGGPWAGTPKNPNAAANFLVSRVQAWQFPAAA